MVSMAEYNLLLGSQGIRKYCIHRKVYKTIWSINLKVIIMGGVIGPAEMEKIKKNQEKKKKSK